MVNRMINVSESALESIKRMAEDVQKERDDLLWRLKDLLEDADQKSTNGAGWTLAQFHARNLIAKIDGTVAAAMQTK